MSQVNHPLASAEDSAASRPKARSSLWAFDLRLINWTSVFFAILQSACTVVITISGARVLIGLGALAAAAGVDVPARGFHADSIRIPMMAFALAGSLLNLYVVMKVRRLRNRQAARWRQQPVSRKKLNSERLQIALSALTLLLLAAEWILHPFFHRVS